MNTPRNKCAWHVVVVKHTLTPKQIIDLASWCHRNVVFHTWDWGGGRFRFKNLEDAVQFALLLD